MPSPPSSFHPINSTANGLHSTQTGDGGTRRYQGAGRTDLLSICKRCRNFIPATEANFNKLQEILHLYEVASGAKLNLSKSVNIPLGLPIVPQWIHDTGCTISGPTEIHKYLGARFGHQLKSSELHKFCLDWINKRISSWSNKLLSFTGKMLLLQHVLHNINVYHMMYMATPKGTVRQINKIFKDFLWGFDKEIGRQKTPLVAWKRMTQP